MNSVSIIVESYFDGVEHRNDGPYRIEVRDGLIKSIAKWRQERTENYDRRIDAGFAMPGLVEAHAHLFLDGGELNFETRKQYLKASPETMLKVGKTNLEISLAAGITLIRDAGDIYGINTRLQEEFRGSTAAPEIISAGKAVRKKGCYGSFMAVEASEVRELAEIVKELAQNADQLKILLTGIIDFEKGEMRGGPQFSLEEAKLIAATARRIGRLTFAHCSGMEGLRMAVEARVDSVEHGFFMEHEVVEQMAERGMAWVPTFSPVHFQYEHPEKCGWNPETVSRLWKILENHFREVAVAQRLGVRVMAGSDAGSYGVPHGQGLIQELLFLQAAGIPMKEVLASASSIPRRAWGREPADIRAGNKANIVLLEGSPFEDAKNLYGVSTVILCKQIHAVKVRTVQQPVHT